MPKNNAIRKTATGGVIRTRTASKLRIGNRKGGKSALLMSTQQLKDVLNDENKTRWHPNAITVLLKRGVYPDWPGKLNK